MQQRQRDAFPFEDDLIAQLFIIQSEMSDQQQRERLTLAISLRNITLENYTYEMLKTQYHDLSITTRTSIQDPSIRPQGGNRSNTFFMIEQGEPKEKKAFGLRMKKDNKDSCRTTMKRRFGSSGRTMRSLREKCLGGISGSKGRKKGKSGSNKGSHRRGGFKPFKKSGSGGKGNMANENYNPYDQAYWRKGKSKKGKKRKSKFQYPFGGNIGYPIL